MPRSRLGGFFLTLLILPSLLLFYPSLWGGAAFLPGDLLQQVYPWRSTTDIKPAALSWNVLRFDGITQFYPWRLAVARSLRAGNLPLWNPYQFGASGGTPLLANSQSAPLYPPNLIFTLLPPDHFWYGFGLSAALHLLIVTAGTFVFARAIGLSRIPALLSAFTFALSAPVVTWLALPTFLAVFAWTPWLLLLIRCAFAAKTRPGAIGATVGAGAVAGLLMLAGHLQIAFYALLTGGLYAVFLGWQGLRRGEGRNWLLRAVVGIGGAILLALLLVAPQLLPSIELSRVSHRAGGASWETYQVYVRNALPLRNLVTLLVPNFFGHPNRLYWNDSPIGNNYAEWAGYIGIFPLVLAVFALAQPWRRNGDTSDTVAPVLPSERTFFALLAMIALCLAMGTPLNLLFYFGVPGFGQTGNPARSLIVFAFALSLLAGMGLQTLTPESHSTTAKMSRAALIALAVPLVAGAVGASFAARFAHEFVPGASFGDLMQAAAPGLRLALVLFVLAGATLLIAPRLGIQWRRFIPPGILILTVLDLFVWGGDYNPTAAPETIYPVTPGIAWLQQNAPDDLIAPLNRGWSVNQTAPRRAILPPNGATVYGLHDLSGYDSLFPGAAKEQVRHAAADSDDPDPSPKANGNMVFVKSGAVAVALGARFILTPPGAEGENIAPPGLERVYAGADMTIYENPAGSRRHTPGTLYAPASFRLGLFLGLCGVGVICAIVTAGLIRLTRRV